MRSFDDPGQIVQVAVGETFVISLASNPTTGYTWQAETEPEHLEWLGQEFQPGDSAVGAGGSELVRFLARQMGETRITFEYRRPWGGEARDIVQFQVLIS